VNASLDIPFNFDDWAELAQRDAEAFEQRRREVIEAAIAEAPDHMHTRLQRLQWRIDAERNRYKHPLKSCVVIFNMMWDSVYGEHGLLQALNALNNPDPALASQAPAASPAKVLPFRGY
jgi:hypothetical protein